MIVNIEYFAIVTFLAIFVIVINELIRKKLRIDYIQKEMKELAEKLKKNPEFSDEDMEKLIKLNKELMKFMFIPMVIIIPVLYILVKVLGDIKILEFERSLPIINKNWIGALGTYIIVSIILSTIVLLYKKYKTKFLNKDNG